MTQADPAERIRYLVATGEQSFNAGDYAGAKVLYEELLTYMVGPDEERSSAGQACLANLSAIYYTLGDLKKARGMYSRLVLVSVSVHGEQNREVISQMFMLAKICDELKDFEDAASIYARVMTLSTKFLKPDDPLRDRIHRAYAASGASTSSLRQTLALKALEKKEDSPQEAPTLVNPQIHRLLHTDQFTASAICSIALIIAAAAWIGILFPAEDGVPTLPGDPAAQAAATTFVSSDGTVTFTETDPKNAVLKSGDEELHITVNRISPSVSAIPQILEGAFSMREMWFSKNDRGVVLENGIELYSKASPEFTVIEKMQSLAKSAADLYAKKKTYPAKPQDWKDVEELAYLNPLTRKPIEPNIQTLSKFTGLEIIFSGAKTDEEIRSHLATGGKWYREPEPVPCAIHCCAIYSGEKVGDQFAADQLYIHGFDQKGSPIKGPTPNSTYFIALKKGESHSNVPVASSQTASLFKAIPNARIYLAPANSDLFGVIPFKYIASVLVLGLILLLGVVWFGVDAKKRITNPRRLPTLLEMLIVALLIGWIAMLTMRLISSGI